MLEFLSAFGENVLTFAVYLSIALFTVLFSLGFLISSLRSQKASFRKYSEIGRVSIAELNDEYDSAIESANAVIERRRVKTPRKKKGEKTEDSKRLFILDFFAGIAASEVETLRHEVTLIQKIARQEDEILLRLGSPGGQVSGYSLAADQINRLKEAGLFITTSVDLMAASGGYWVSVVGQRVIAAPQAILGSIGVVIEFPNMSDLLERIGVSVESFTSGKYKRPLSPFTETTEEGKKWAERRVKTCFQDFYTHISTHRPEVELEQIKEGDVWSAQEALEKNLIDGIQLSDDFILEKLDDGYRVFHVSYQETKPLMQRIITTAASVIIRQGLSVLQRSPYAH